METAAPQRRRLARGAPVLPDRTPWGVPAVSRSVPRGGKAAWSRPGRPPAPCRAGAAASVDRANDRAGARRWGRPAPAAGAVPARLPHPAWRTPGRCRPPRETARAKSVRCARSWFRGGTCVRKATGVGGRNSTRRDGGIAPKTRIPLWSAQSRPPACNGNCTGARNVLERPPASGRTGCGGPAPRAARGRRTGRGGLAERAPPGPASGRSCPPRGPPPGPVSGRSCPPRGPPPGPVSGRSCPPRGARARPRSGGRGCRGAWPPRSTPRTRAGARTTATRSAPTPPRGRPPAPRRGRRAP